MLKAVLPTTLLLLGLVLGLRLVVLGTYVEAISMQPSLESGQLLLVNKLAYRLGPPERGDLVVFDAPTAPGRNYVKRVIGLPGDMVLVDDGRVSVNGQTLDEPYVHYQADYTFPSDGQAVQVPADAYFVLGDNRPDSADSHLGWFVPSSKLIGKPLALALGLPGRSAPSAPQLRSPAPVRIGMLPGQPWLDLGPATTQWLHGRIDTDEVGWFVARQAPLPVPIRDAVVSATFRKVGGAPGGSTGLIVRSSGAADYYTFELHDDGRVAVWRRAGDSWFELLPPTDSPAVRPGAAPNQLTARVVGAELAFLVNDTEMATLTDDGLPEGGAGVFVEGASNAVEFQQFLVEPL